MDLLTNFSERLKELMFDANIKSDKLGEAIGVTGQAVRKWTSGSRLIFRTQLIKIVEYFNCSIEFLIGRTENKIDFEPYECPVFYERLRAVMEKYGISYYRLVNDTRFRENFIDQWKNGSDPHLETLLELADYFGCTIDYLVGRER